MRLKTIIRKVPGEYTRDGHTVPVTRDHTTVVPALPRNWNVIALRGAVSIVVALTMLSVVWSTWSIGSLLGGGVGFVVAVIFDVGWAVALIMEYLSKYDKNKRTFPERLGWVLLVATMAAIALHGAQLGSWEMAVVGALVSFFAKVLWIGVMKHVNADLSEDDQVWLADQISQAQTKAAIAEVRRQTGRIEQRAMLEMLAMEKERHDVRAAFGLDQETAPEIETVEAEKVRPELAPPTLAHMGKSDAIRYVRSQLPELEASEIADLLGDEGVDVKPEYVTQVLNRKRPEPESEVADVIALRK